MQSLYEFLKASKGLPVSDSYAALWGKSAAESGIKTLTGRLPIFFRMSENKLRDWVIYGNNEPGKNLLDLGEYDTTSFGLRAYAENGQLRIVGKYNDTSAHTPFRFYTYLEAGDFILSGAPKFSNTGYQIQAGTVTDSSGVGFVTIGYDRGDGLSFTIESASWVAIRVYTAAAAYGIDVDFTMPIMVRRAGTSAAFEPYQIGVGKKTENGYVLNIGVGFAPISPFDPTVALYTRKTINLGESPLTEGQTLSMSELGDIRTVGHSDLFIAAFEGFNYDSQLSYNQPTMMIKFKE